MKTSPARNHYLIAFWVTLVISISLLIGGFFTPPRAEIDGSLLEATGLLFLWPALAFGNKALEEGKVARIQKGNTVITVGDDDGPEPIEEEGETETL